jgi:peroxiredoxin/outer membrane lipoprotein-sorting protein
MIQIQRGVILIASIVSVSLFALVSGTAREKGGADSNVRGDVSALVLYRTMIRTIRNAKSLYYESDYVWESEGREIGRSNYRMWLKKPNYARLESRSNDGTRSGIIVLDGREMWIYWPDGRPYIPMSDSTANARDDMKSYLQKKASNGSHSIGHETSILGTGMSMTIFDPSIFHGSVDGMDRYLESVKNAGSATVAGEECSVIEVSFMNGQRRKVFWISRRDHLPRKLEETVRATRDIVVREFWRNVERNGKISKKTFVWKPPADWAEYRMPTLGDGLLKHGSEAPDFDVQLLDGSRFRLVEYRGTVVWLVFWRLACPPCRIELPHLQKLHQKYNGNGIMIVGFNFADDRNLAIEFLREKSVTFPNIVDTSAVAQEIYYRRYQTLKGQSAVPLNYIIDRQGTVVHAWYGYDRGDDRGERILRKMGEVK